jgi:hypothetical protein
MAQVTVSTLPSAMTRERSLFFLQCEVKRLAQTASSRRCSDSVSNVRVEQTKSGRSLNVARDPSGPELSQHAPHDEWKERSHFERATERDASDMFGSLNDDRD